MQGDEIGFREDLVALQELRSQLVLYFGGGARRVIVNDAHPEASCPPRYRSPDAAKAQNAQRFPPHVGAANLVEVPSLPVAGTRQGIPFEKTPGHRQQQGPREIGGGL